MEKEWQKKFNLSTEDYNKWENSSQTDNFAVWALKNNKLHPDQYMDWATQHYQMPFLTNSFFHNITINQEFWNRTQDRENWDETFLPLYEWDKVLFAGCIKPPEKKLDTDIVLILALPKNLNIFWEKIKKFSEAKSNTGMTKNTVNTTIPENNNQKTSGFFLKPTAILNTIINNTLISQLKTMSGNKIYEQIFSISEKYFTGVTIFSFKNNEFKPVEWTDSMAGPAKPIKIKEPSIFKMIVNSRSSYHGFIVKNKHHDQFFTPRGFSILPKHVTLVPVFNNTKNIIGAFMGVSDKIIHQKHLYEIKEWTKPLEKPLLLQGKEKKYKAAA